MLTNIVANRELSELYFYVRPNRNLLAEINLAFRAGTEAVCTVNRLKASVMELQTIF